MASVRNQRKRDKKLTNIMSVQAVEESGRRRFSFPQALLCRKRSFPEAFRVQAWGDMESFDVRKPFLSKSGFSLREEKEQPSIVVVDDSEIQCRILQKWLGERYTLRFFHSGMKALEGLETMVPPHLLLVDLNLPNMDGLSFISKLKEKAVVPPIIVMSATRSEHGARQSLDAGGEDFLVKPLIRELLEKKVASVLERERGKLKEAAYQTIVANKDKQIQHLENQLSRATTANSSVKTPMQDIVNYLNDLNNDPIVVNTPRLQKTIDAVMSRLNEDLYQPVFQQIDQVKDSFLEETFLTPQFARRRSTVVNLPLSTSEDMKDVMDIAFNQFDVSQNNLLPILKGMFDHFDLCNVFKVNPTNLVMFLGAVKSNYKRNPYHNFRHAFEVTHSAFLFLTEMEGSQLLCDLDIFAILLAALCHDLQHPGTNNNHQTLILNELALTYNDRSVLENHHCSLGFKLLMKYSIIENLDEQEKKEFRSSFIDLILGTDPAVHYEKVTKLKQRIEQGDDFDPDSPDDRKIVRELFLHAADIGNIAKPWPISKQWADRITEEFFRQGDTERRIGYDVAPFMDRNKSSKPETILNFINFVAADLIHCLAQVLPKAIKSVEEMQQNRQNWLVRQVHHTRDSDPDVKLGLEDDDSLPEFAEPARKNSKPSGTTN